MRDSRKEYQQRGLYVEVRGNDVARALRKLKKLINAEGVVKELRDKEYYEKPSLKRKKAKAAARKRHLKELEKKNDI
jgi:small subunit ribosomal protein S21|tara:strand:- start:1800 stop:2030 length:231 start_codon:yes stop_codon:yes gene_type:complete